MPKQWKAVRTAVLKILGKPYVFNFVLHFPGHIDVLILVLKERQNLPTAMSGKGMTRK